MRRRAPAFWQRRYGVALLLSPLSLVYRAGHRLRWATARAYRAGLPVICVGNASVGGAGKTPVVAALATLLTEDGRRIAIVSRGYGGSLRGPLAVAAAHRAGEVGDEPKMLSARFPVWIGRDRAAALRGAVAAGAELAILDDGLQNPHVAKTLSFLVIDGEAGIANGRMLPAGPLREPLSAALRKADAVVLIGDDRQGLADRLAGRPVFAARLVADIARVPVAGQRWLAFAGIGRPEKFFTTVEAEGGTLAGRRPFPDHYAYESDELLALELEAASLGARLVTTEKDAARLPPEFRDRIAVLPVRIAWRDEAGLRSFLAQRLGRS